MFPETSEVNLTPTSTAEESLNEGIDGTVLLGQIVQGHGLGVTVSDIPAEGVSRLPLSSTDRLFIVADPVVLGL
jgi:hypothetical protein